MLTAADYYLVLGAAPASAAATLFSTNMSFTLIILGTGKYLIETSVRFLQTEFMYYRVVRAKL